DPESEVIIMSRKLNKLDGSYGGVVLAAIDPKYFVDFFDSVSRGENHFMSIALSDGTVMVSGPEKNASNLALQKLLTEKATDLTKEKSFKPYFATQDGVDKVFANNRLGSFPVTVSIALDSRDFLSSWKNNQFKDLLFLTIFLLFGTALSLFAVTMEKQIKRVQRSEAAAVLASQTKSEFLANMSHEFRTPLNAIIGFSDMLLATYFGDLNEKQKERVHDINLCGNHLLQLINDILEFSKGEAGKLELREELVEIAQTIEECKRMMREKLNLKHISMTAQLDQDHPALLGDARKVRQILLNLVSNAVKFTPHNGSITVSSYVDDAGFLRLSVADTGIGMAEADIPKAMSVFGQVHRNQSLEGTGLGLPLCKIFAELHGGNIYIASTVGVGTTVEVSFPPERILSSADIAKMREDAYAFDDQGLLPLADDENRNG
ncbi:MAG: hypothetical protein FJX23_08365, partial [Alphaproteobacteria bacterium]|nr:hypothetical protein [Alphaproteobacteria bacterium]